MTSDKMILGSNQYYSLDSYKTKLNNNVLVVGASGCGKTRGIVIPNLLQATGSYIVSDPKGNLYDKYGDYLREQGYEVKKLDFTDPLHSARYNFFEYIHNTQDIAKIAYMLIRQGKEDNNYRIDPFWDDSSQLLLQAIMGLVYEENIYLDQNLHGILKILSYLNGTEDLSMTKTKLDIFFDSIEKKRKNSYAVSMYNKVRVSADKTMRSILICIFARLGVYDTPELNWMMSADELDIPRIGMRKTALFVVVSDTDRSMDVLADIFFTQAMNELCLKADKECEDNRLPVPVRFILDDFATNCRIGQFPRMIAAIRSRNISTMLMVQTESQLKESYGEDGKTIISNCDTYVYMGGNDLETATAVSMRCDIPMKKILNMPIGTSWIFRRGQEPVNGTCFDLDAMLRQKKLLKPKKAKKAKTTEKRDDDLSL